MKKLDRRKFLKLSAGALGAAAAGSFLPGSFTSRVLAQGSGNYEPMFPIEDGARLRLLRWTGFIDSDEELWNQNTQRFTELTGVPVQIQSVTWTDVQPKSALAAQLGSGPDVIMGWYDDPHIYPDQLIDVSELAEYLGNKYGGWYDVARSYGFHEEQGRWIAIPVGAAGNAMNYRTSWIQEAGFDTFPEDTDGFLKMAQALKKNGHPTGFALGHAVGDGNTWVHWLLWAFGGKIVNEDNTVAVNSSETRAALEYAKELYETMVPGVSSWLDANNNRAFLAEQCSLTQNGISIWYVAQNDFPAIADDVANARNPVGPVSSPTNFNLFTQAFIFKYSKFPNAAQEYLRFMLESEQMDPWVTAMTGYVTPALRAYRELPIWTRDPDITPYRDVLAGAHSNAWAGAPGKRSARALNDFVVVDMFADACAQGASPQQAAERAERQLAAIYG
jgi:multiple sugar transport system substrate-binding protein